MSNKNLERKIKNKKSTKHSEKHKKRIDEHFLLESTSEFAENLKEDENLQSKENLQNLKDREYEITSEESSPYKQILNSSIRENAKRIRKEFLGREHSANNYLAFLNKIVSQFETVKLQLKSKSNYYLNYLFSIMGYKYRSEIKGINFFHFASQSWLLEVFKIICLKFPSHKKMCNNVKESDENYSFSDILTEILNVKIEEAFFLRDLELITGTIYFNDAVLRLTEMKVGKYFLESINSVTIDLKNEEIPESLSKENFENKLMEILIKSVESTLNKIDKLGRDLQYESSGYILFYQKLQTLIEKNKESDFKDFIKILLEDPVLYNNKRPSDDISFLKSAEAFYNFSTLKLDQIIEDLIAFNSHSTSFFYKLKVVIFNNQEKITSMYSTMYNTLLDSYNISKAKISYGLLEKYYNQLVNQFNNLREIKLITGNITKFEDYSNWITLIYNKINHFYPKSFLDKVSKMCPLISYYENIYSPAKDLIITVTNTSVNMIINFPRNLMKNFNNLVKNVSEMVMKNYYFIKDDIKFSKEKLIDFNYEKERDLFIISLSRKLQIIDSKCFSMLIKKIYNILNLEMIKENSFNIYFKAKENSFYLKEALINKYKSFFSCFSLKEKN